MGRTFRFRKRNRSSLKQIKDEHVINLVQWMKTRGLDRYEHKDVYKHLKTAVFPDTGRGLFTVKNINSGGIIISIPESLFITKTFVYENTIGDVLRNFQPKGSLDDIDALTIFLMYERLRCSDSSIHQYLRTLPTAYTTPPYFSKCATKKLPCDLKTEVNVQRLFLMRKYQSLRPIFSMLCPQHSQSQLFQLFLWAWFTVNTRCVYVNAGDGENCLSNADSVALIPFLDLLNHSPQAKIKAAFVPSKRTFDIITQSKIRKYSQVFISYGNHSNRKLLMEYGFVVPNNPNDIIPISPDEIVSATFQAKGVQKNNSILTKNLDAVKEKGFTREGMGCSSEGLTWNTVVSIRALTSKKFLRTYEDILKNVSDGSNSEDFHAVATKLLQNKLEEYLLMTSQENNLSILPDNTDIVVKNFLLEEMTILRNAIALYL